MCDPETAENIETTLHVFEPFKNGMQAVAESVRLADENGLNAYRAQSRLRPFSPRRTSRGNLRGTAALLRHSVRSEAIKEIPIPGTRSEGMSDGRRAGDPKFARSHTSRRSKIGNET